MVNEHRIKELQVPTSQLVADASGNLQTFTTVPPIINGELRKISFLGGNFTATGSLLITISGTNENVFNLVSGAILGNVAAGGVVYPVAYRYNYDRTSPTGSPSDYITVTAPLKIVGSGLGNGTSGLGILMNYL